MDGNVAVLHSEFDFGGGEAVCFHVLEAIKDDCDVTLFTLDDADLAANAEQFGFVPEGYDVVSFDRAGSVLRTVNGLANRLTGDAFGTQHPLKAALLHRLVRRRVDEFDLVVATKSEAALPAPTIQYVHRPLFTRHRAREPFGTDGFGAHYQRVVTRLAGMHAAPTPDDTIVTNSSWTADHLAELYDVEPTVVHPPVEVEEFEPTDWAEKEDGFVTIGRISPDKNVEQAIDVVEAVRERGHDVHLHVVGPPNDRQPEYYERIRERAASTPGIHLEGKLPRDELVQLVEDHRWGLHTKPYEHFGIAVAELVAGGAVPFVPDSGGQADIVGSHPATTYTDVSDAVDKICSVLEDEATTREVRESVPDATTYGTARFRSEFRELVAQKLD